jgi:hypothetical protein
MGNEDVLTALPHKHREGENSTGRIKESGGSPDSKYTLQRTSTKGTNGKMKPSVLEMVQDGKLRHCYEAINKAATVPLTALLSNLHAKAYHLIHLNCKEFAFDMLLSLARII